MPRLMSLLLVLLIPSAVLAGGNDRGWAAPKYSKVVGYQFKDPAEPSEGALSLLKDGSVDLLLLDSLVVKKVELSGSQVRTLTSAINSEKEQGPAACYSPHHIFLFYSESGEVV